MTAAQFTIELDASDLKWIVEHMVGLTREQILAVGEPYLSSYDIEAFDNLPDIIMAIIVNAWFDHPPGVKLGPGKLPELRAAIERLLPEDSL